LKRLKRNSDSAQSGKAPVASPTEAAPSSSRRWKGLTIAAALVLAAGAGAWWMVRGRSTTASGGGGGQTTIAILPFQNLSGDASLDYLRIALPDEISTTLSYIPTLAIRPFASTQKYAQGNLDPQAAGRELQVADVLTGHFQKEGDQLRLTLEVIDTGSNRLLWRDASSAAASDLIGLREQLASRLRQGLFPLLGGAAGAGGGATLPKNPEAYDLYLRSKPATSDRDANVEATKMLERSVGLDPDYAPAWAALGNRYYYDGSAGNVDAYPKAVAAAERALALDPNLSEATQYVIVMATERGDLEHAYVRALDFVRRRPGDPRAHFTLSYVLRYAGLLDEAARECESALAADPRSRELRSCGLVYTQLGRYDRARDFLGLDPGAQWSKMREAEILLREGKREEAAAAVRLFPGWRPALMNPATGREERDRMAVAQERNALASPDSEAQFMTGGFLAWAGYPDAALRLLRKAVERNYLCVPAMDKDPFFDSVRKTPEFAAIRQEAVRRQKEFVARRNAPGSVK
jgi:TolB-like protein/Tfp pilus assembly protein PilF